ncbi:MAG: hypothetical protein ACLSUZ_07980 [Bifidobacterium pseudocatenulatum]
MTNAVSQADGSDGKITLEDAMAYSSNTAFAQLGVALVTKGLIHGRKTWFRQSDRRRRFRSTGTPWVSVASNFPTDASDDKLALASIGQGDTVATPLQNALVAAAWRTAARSCADVGGLRAFLRSVGHLADQAACDEPRVQFGHRG